MAPKVKLKTKRSIELPSETTILSEASAGSAQAAKALDRRRFELHHAESMEKKWRSRLKRAETKIRKWRRRRLYYQKAIQKEMTK